MHESSLIEYTMNAVELKALELNIETIKSIHLTCGKLKGAVPMLMQEAFKILATQRPLFQNTILEVEEAPIVIQCRDCGQETEIAIDAVSQATCGGCGSKNYHVVQGNELRIDYFEGE